MSDVEDADNATAMAAAMGFSSFGAQQPNKRRKFNPNTDAFVAPNSPSTSTSISALPFHRYNERGGHTETTGSNMIPLGVRKQNGDEIDLDGDEDVEQITQPSTAYDDDEFEPQHLDTSRPSAPIITESTDSLQSQIDAIVGGSREAYIAPQLPPAFIASAGSSNPSGRSGRQRHMNRDSQSGTKWWEDYYDPAFITNPWDTLEKARGLEPRGLWISWEEAKAAKTTQT